MWRRGSSRPRKPMGRHRVSTTNGIDSAGDDRCDPEPSRLKPHPSQNYGLGSLVGSGHSGDLFPEILARSSNRSAAAFIASSEIEVHGADRWSLQTYQPSAFEHAIHNGLGEVIVVQHPAPGLKRLRRSDA